MQHRQHLCYHKLGTTGLLEGCCELGAFPLSVTASNQPRTSAGVTTITASSSGLVVGVKGRSTADVSEFESTLSAGGGMRKCGVTSPSRSPFGAMSSSRRMLISDNPLEAASSSGAILGKHQVGTPVLRMTSSHGFAARAGISRVARSSDAAAKLSWLANSRAAKACPSRPIASSRSNEAPRKTCWVKDLSWKL